MTLENELPLEADEGVVIEYNSAKLLEDRDSKSNSFLENLFEKSIRSGYATPESPLQLIVDEQDVRLPSRLSLASPSSIPPDLANEIEGILRNPYSFQGDLKVQIGSKTVYWNKSGDIAVNLLDLPGQRYTRNRNETDLEKIRTSRLREMASELGIEQPQELNKQQLIDAIQSARSEVKETLDPLAGPYEKELFQLRTELESTRNQLHSALRALNDLQFKVDRLSRGAATVPGVENRVTKWLQRINDYLLNREKTRLASARDRHESMARTFDQKLNRLERAINPTIINQLRTTFDRAKSFFNFFRMFF